MISCFVYCQKVEYKYVNDRVPHRFGSLFGSTQILLTTVHVKSNTLTTKWPNWHSTCLCLFQLFIHSCLVISISIQFSILLEQCFMVQRPNCTLINNLKYIKIDHKSQKQNIHNYSKMTLQKKKYCVHIKRMDKFFTQYCTIQIL